MKTLTINGEQFHAERIVKTATNIIGYNGNAEVFSFKGISDFTQFILAESQEWDTDLSPDARIQALEEAVMVLL